MKILTVLGARPQFVKAAVLSRAIIEDGTVEEVIVHTGQHFDKNMSDLFFQEMEIPKPKYMLNINSMGHGAMTGKMLEQIEKIIIDEKPDFVLVFGDTNSTLAGALAAKKLNVKLAHVEAGLRSFNMTMPEEINRILTDRISDYLFCPTKQAVENLKLEGFDNFTSNVVLSGDIMKEAVSYYSEKSALKSTIISDLKLKNEAFVLGSIHRQENTDNLDRLKGIVGALNQINTEQRVIVPIHPRTKAILEKNHIEVNFDLIDPVGYFDMLELLKNCSLVMTDSGGLQKEAYFSKKNCLILRDETEWVELVENNFAVVCGADSANILKQYKSIANLNKNFYLDLYGKDVSKNILKTLKI
jgi:UDP-GlcNAc3NAcA epimerase